MMKNGVCFFYNYMYIILGQKISKNYFDIKALVFVELF